MPYQPPSPSSPTTTRARNHRRSASFSDEKGPGAFVSLGQLPKVQRKPSTKKPATFHFRDDDDDSPEEGSSPLPAENIAIPPPMAQEPVPFPMSSPTGSGQSTPQLTADSPGSPQRPALTRGSSQPVLLSNGKPLKSSLKSSASAPVIPEDVRSLHLRAQSAPTTPFLSKNVHFPEKREDGLEDVRVFSRKARPASVSLPPGMGLGDETETETEQETNSRFPFPRFTPANPAPVPHAPALLKFEIDYQTPHATSPIPTAHPPALANVHLESLAFAQPAAPAASAPHLTGTVLVRNIAYEKHVAVRFTLDDWQTTSEVRATHAAGVSRLPWEGDVRSRTLGDAVGAIASAGRKEEVGGWDRFGFNIRLEDHAYKLHERVLWLVARYTTGGGAEWWDNNSSHNYRVGFRLREEKPELGHVRSATAPEPTSKKTFSGSDFGMGFDFQNVSLSPASGYIAPSTPRPTPPRPTMSFNPSTAPSPSSSFTARRGHGLNLLNYAAPGSAKVAPPTITTNFTTSPRAAGDTDDEEIKPLAAITNRVRSPMGSPSLGASARGDPLNYAAPKKRASPPHSPGAGRKPEGTLAGWNWNAPSSALAQRALSTGADSPSTPTGHGGASSSRPAPQQSQGGAPGQGLHFAWGLGAAPLGAPPRALSPPTRPFSPTSAASPTGAFGSLGSLGAELGGSGDSSEELYQAFVKQWCFAQTPSAVPAAAGPAAAAPEVLVG